MKNRLPAGFVIGDARDMSEVDDGSVTLIVTSPPYNIGKEYEEGMTFEGWLDLMESVMKECDRVLMDGGRACFNVPTGIHRNPAIPIDYHVMRIGIGLGWWQRARIIWLKPATSQRTMWGSYRMASNPAFRDAHEIIIVFNKGSESIGTGKSGISAEEFIEFTRSEWLFMPESATQVGHPAPFPDELPRRCILLLSNIGDVVLDPFGGSGTTYKVAKVLRRNPLSYEKNAGYVPVILNRLDEPVHVQSDATERRKWIEKNYPGFHDKTRTELVKACKERGIKASVENSKVSMMEALSKHDKTKTLDQFFN